MTARWLLGFLAAAWLVFALSVVVLHGWIVPRIGNYRAALEAQASRAIGVPVRIASITADAAGLFPSFELRDVVLFDAQQREALRLARVVASVSPRSLFRLSFEQLYIQGPELDVRRDKLGKLHVAGLDMSTDTSGEKRGADWFFAQREFVIEGGRVRWTDEGSGADPLMLTDVSFIARNGGRRHAMRLDATPPEGWGERFTLRGQFRQPLLSVRSGNWQSWDGEVYADLPGFDVSRLGRYAALDVRIREGNGAVRVWADVKDGQWVGGAADLALARVDTTLGDATAPLMMRGLGGRVAGRLTGKMLEVSTRGLQFETADGARWPGGDFWLQHTPQQGRTPERGAIKAERLDLGVLALIANRLPLGTATHKALAEFAPRGLVDRIDATWQGSLGAPDRYQAKGRASSLQVASQPAAAPAGAGKTPAAGRPGVRGLTIDFEASQAGGKATLSVAQGALDFPGVFEEPVIPIDQLAGQLQWQLDGGSAQVQLGNLRFANADAQGEAQIGWRTSDPALRGGARYPGVLDLQGKLTRADGTRVFRYLPQHIGKDVRDYVHDAVVKGNASSVDFRVRGDLIDMPFTDPRRGDFRIAARVADVTYAFVPPARGSTAPSHWPALTGLAGELVFERAGMQVRNARGRLVGAPGVEVSKAEAQIADMAHAALLQLDVQAKGALGELLQLAVPLAGAASDAARQARASGSADYRLKLALPLAAMDKAKVQASIAFGGNELQVAPEAPPFTQLRGTLNFTESGFTLAGAQARLVGGDVRVEGRGRYGGAGHDMSFSGQGTATAEGLRGARQVDWLARLARKATGSAPYTASFGLRDGASEFSLNSSLQGLGLQLPAPLTKTADEALQLRIDKKVVLREARAGAAPLLNDQLSLELGRIVTARYDRDISGDEPRVLRGGVGVGLAPGESAAPPARGVLANVNLARIDLDAWKALFDETTGNAPEAPASGAAAPVAAADDAQGYLPSIVALRAQELRVSGRKLGNVVIGGSREGNLWRGNIDATELSGYVEYRQAQAGRIYARLARLKIAPSETTEVESLLDAQPATLPALDIVVDDFELLGKRLGKLEVAAVNRGGAEREWQLDKLNLSTPEATFSARGSWAAAPSGRPRAGQRRTAMAFKLDMTDAGALLARLGMKDVVARGRGRMEGDVEWRGSPFSLDYPSMSGQLNVNLEQGQFLKAEPGIAKLLGVLSLQALPRRLTLDFRDVFSTGFAFDFVRGDARIVDGVATTNNLQMKGVNAAVLMDGSANLAKETQDLHVVVVPEINAGTASLVATAINPAIGLGTFLAQMVLRRPLIAAATQEFRVDGTWADPKVTRLPRRPATAAPLPPTARDDPKTETTQ